MKKNFYLFLVVFTVSMFWSVGVSAAELFFRPVVEDFSLNREFVVDVYLDTQEESINAIEGDIIFPKDVLRVKDIRDGNSSINFWINRPSLSREDDITFSGITPGGLGVGENKIFSIIFEPIVSNEADLTFKNIKVLKNDGLGTRVSVDILDLSIYIDENEGGESFVEDLDSNPPEDFVPFVGRDASLYEGKYFLVFSTQDKGAGVLRYEVKEGFFGDYFASVSPYVLTNQKLNKRIYVKAIDKNGNERVVLLKPENYKDWYKDPLFLGIILLSGLGLYFRKRWLEHSNYLQ